MNHDLEHQELANLLNRRIQHAAENKRMEEMESRATPLFVAFIVAVILGVSGLGLTRYVNAQNAELQHTAQILADCLNGKAVLVEDSIMRCTIKHYPLVEGMKVAP